MSTSYVNQHEFTGWVGKVEDAHYFKGGSVVTKFSVAVPRPYESETSNWCNCEAWSKLAETAANFLEKGKLVTCQGEMRTESWTDKTTGELRTKTVFNVNRLKLISAKKKDEVKA